ncbi:S8 family serine peptidase [Nocardioides nematodiphilus]|uniref:S8 family serine peptidase n=1 Tax=Nocardioides nematodiphilus TaxID=2849669 RepID=UPI001CD9A9CA|nr:S8 family serine peptidase [Nocardioides nematodiphilus]MCA1983701.1 S8 family serine peptidase [Nocardioides nematodiphilus]
MKSCSLVKVALLSTILTTVGLLAVPHAAVAVSSSDPAAPALIPVAAAPCPTTPAPGQVTCLARSRPASVGAVAPGARPRTSAPASGTATPLVARNQSDSYTPSDLASLYRIPADLTPTDTIGIVDVGSDPNTEAQMTYFRRFFRLPACTSASGCFREVAQDGSRNLPASNAEWTTEIAIDVQAVSGICPTCHILLVDAATANTVDMAKAALTATRLGATYLSLSYGSPESSSTPWLRNTYYSNPAVTYVAAAGDSGYGGGALFPASATNVVAAGGTSVKLVNGAWQQTAWSGSGSGCSEQHSISAPQAQESLSGVCGGKRAVSDVSALADPDTGMLFWRGGQWWNGGGTSLAAPILAGLYALAGNHTSPMSVYNATSKLVDVTRGSTGSCTPASLCSAGPGWDGPTGLGTPAGPEALAADGTVVPTYSTATAGTLTGGSGYPVKLSYHLADRVTGAGVRWAPIVLQRRRADGTYASIRSGRTDGRGNAVLTDAPTSATAYRVVFGGTVSTDASTSNALSVTRFRPVVSLRQEGSTLRATLRAPWGGPARSVPVQLQQHRGRWWVSVRSARTNGEGVASLSVRKGLTYRLRYGGGRWQSGNTAPVRGR